MTRRVDRSSDRQTVVHGPMRGIFHEKRKSGGSDRQSSEEAGSRNMVDPKVEETEAEKKQLTELKRKLLIDAGLEDFADLAQTEENVFGKLLELRIEQKRKEVEELRAKNLRTLSIIVDKCAESDKFSEELLGDILQLVDLPRGMESASSLNRKKRRRTSPAMSPRGSHRFASEVARFNVKDPQQYPQQMQNLPNHYHVLYPSGPGATTWLPQHYNTALQPQYQFQNSVPAGLGVRAGRSREPSAIQNNENFVNDQGHSFSTSQFVGASHPSVFAQQHAGPSNRTSLTSALTEPPLRGGPGYFQPSQQLQTHHGIKTEPLLQGAFPSHRRSQSAIVAPAARLHGARSPSNEIQTSPQKPVNFLIHTPKHPPPS